MKNFMRDIVNKNTIITSSPGGGSSSLALLFTNFLSEYYNILYFDTGHSLDRVYIKQFYSKIFNNVNVIQAPIEVLFDYIIELNTSLKDIDYIIIDTGDMLNKQIISDLYNLLKVFDVYLIVTSQLRMNPNTGKPYSTVEEWNKQLVEKPFQNSIWIRKVNEPNATVNRKYVDVYNNFRIGNRYYKRIILNFNKKRGNIT